MRQAMENIRNARRYLLLLALVVLMAFCAYFPLAITEHEATLVREKAYEKSEDVELLAGIVEHVWECDHCRDSGTYLTVLHYAVEQIEASYNSTFAQLYDAGLNPLVELHDGVAGGPKHNPLDYPEFVEAVNNNDSGSLTYWYETDEAGGRDIHMQYRWVHAGNEKSARYLVAVGISRHTIKESMGTWVIYGAATLVIVCSVFVLAATVMLCQLGHVYDRRGGSDKWRNRISL